MPWYREALKFEEDLRVANLQFPTLYTSSPAGPRKALYSPSGNRSEPLFDLLTFSRVPTSSSSEPETLGVGDHICYASEVDHHLYDEKNTIKAHLL